jgi:hypothetical protein
VKVDGGDVGELLPQVADLEGKAGTSKKVNILAGHGLQMTRLQQSLC